MTSDNPRRAPVRSPSVPRTKHRLASHRQSALIFAKLFEGDVCAAYVGNTGFARCARCRAAWGFHPEARR